MVLGEGEADNGDCVGKNLQKSRVGTFRFSVCIQINTLLRMKVLSLSTTSYSAA